MKDLGKIVLHIPAREGSKRVPRKNMRLMNGKPMISYTIEASLKSNITEHMYVNTDSTEIIDFVNTTYKDAKIFKRNRLLASDTASSEDFNLDIINKLFADTLIMINPVCPLICPSDITKALDIYRKNDCDTLITSSSTQMQTFCGGSPINININEALAPSQENKKVTILNWAITIWDTKEFKKRIKKLGYAALGENRLLMDIELIKATKVSEEKDFIFAENIMRSQNV